MAEKQSNRSEGNVGASGDVTAHVLRGDDERAPVSRAVRATHTLASARVTDTGDVVITVTGFAQFGDRTVSKAIDLDPESAEVEAVKEAMQALIEASAELAQDAALEAAYEVRAAAQRSGENVSAERPGYQAPKSEGED